MRTRFNSGPFSSHPARQNGAVLFVGLVMLLLLTLLALSATQVTTLQERMAGNFKNLHDAFETSEDDLNKSERLLLDPLKQPDITFLTFGTSHSLPWTAWPTTVPTVASNMQRRIPLGSFKFGVDPLREPKFFYVAATDFGKDKTSSVGLQSAYVY